MSKQRAKNCMPHSLLYPWEPSTVVCERESGFSPFVFLCDHSGRSVPARLTDLDMSQDDLKRHIAWDVGIAGLGRELSSHFDGCWIMQPYSRLVIDCNRQARKRDLDPCRERQHEDSRKPASVCGRHRHACARNLQSVSPKDLIAPRRAARCGPAYDSRLI